MIILKVTKNQLFTLSLEDTFLDTSLEEIDPLPAVLGLKKKNSLTLGTMHSKVFF